MKLEEVLPAYREGKTIISEDNIHCSITDDRLYALSVVTEKEILGEWKIKEEPKPKVKMWPALFCFDIGLYWNVTGALFATEKEAHAYCKSYKKFIWPAIQGPDGSFEVQQE
jgi:hypothetical protein